MTKYISNISKKHETMHDCAIPKTNYASHGALTEMSLVLPNICRNHLQQLFGLREETRDISLSPSYIKSLHVLSSFDSLPEDVNFNRGLCLVAASPWKKTKICDNIVFDANDVIIPFSEYSSNVFYDEDDVKKILQRKLLNNEPTSVFEHLNTIFSKPVDRFLSHLYLKSEQIYEELDEAICSVDTNPYKLEFFRNIVACYLHFCFVDNETFPPLPPFNSQVSETVKTLSRIRSRMEANFNNFKQYKRLFYDTYKTVAKNKPASFYRVINAIDVPVSDNSIRPFFPATVSPNVELDEDKGIVALRSIYDNEEIVLKTNGCVSWKNFAQLRLQVNNDFPPTKRRRNI